MKDYVKVVLYAYPLLKTVEKDYEEHITNKAMLSYLSNGSAESVAEKIAEEVVEMRNLEWLKGRIEDALAKLTNLELDLLSARYFGRKKAASLGGEWTGRTYFRRQKRVSERVGELLSLGGLTEEVYQSDFASMDIFRRIERRLAKGKK